MHTLVCSNVSNNPLTDWVVRLYKEWEYQFTYLGTFLCLDRITTVSAWGVRCQQVLGHQTVCAGCPNAC